MAKKSPAQKVVEAFSGLPVNDKKNCARTIAADALGVSRQLINYWLKKGFVPDSRQKMILTKAKKLGVELSAADLVNQ